MALRIPSTIKLVQPDPQDQSSKGPWPAIWAIAIAIAALNASELLPASLLTPMSESLGVSEGLIGQSVTATAILAILTSLLIASVTRRMDTRRLLLLAGCVLVLSNAVVALAPNAAVLLAARLVLGVSVGAVWGLAASLAVRLVSVSDVPRAISIIFGGATVATVAAAPLAAFFGGIIGWRGVFAIVAAFSAVALLGLLTLPAMPPVAQDSPTGMGHTLLLPGLLPGLLGVILFWGGMQTFNTYLRPYLETVPDLGTGGVSSVLLVFGLTNLLGTLLAGPLMSWRLRLVLPATAAAEALFLGLLIAFGQAQWAATVCIASWGVFVGMAGVGWSTWIASSYREHAAPAGGALVAAIQGSMMLGAVFGGVLIDGYSTTAPLVGGAILLALAAVYVALIMRASRPVSSPARSARASTAR